MNLHALEIFRAVAHLKSVSRAAESLMISQPAVSKQLRQLEQSLGRKLLERSSRGVTLTDAGEVLVDYADRIFALAHEAETNMRQLNPLRAGKISIGITPSLGTYILPKVIVYLRQRYPGVQIRTEMQSAERLKSLLQDRVLDVALSPADMSSNEFVREITCMEDVLPIVSARHRFASGRRVQAAEFLREPLIAREPSSHARSFVETALAGRGLRIEPAMTFASTEAVKQGVAAGLGVAWLPRIAIEHELAAKRLVIAPIRSLHFRRPVYHVRPRSGPVNKLVPALITVFRHAMRGTLPEKPRLTLK